MKKYKPWTADQNLQGEEKTIWCYIWYQKRITSIRFWCSLRARADIYAERETTVSAWSVRENITSGTGTGSWKTDEMKARDLHCLATVSSKSRDAIFTDICHHTDIFNLTTRLCTVWHFRRSCKRVAYPKNDENMWRHLRDRVSLSRHVAFVVCKYSWLPAWQSCDVVNLQSKVIIA